MAPHGAIDLAQLCVLVLDDEQYFRALLLRVLERLGIGIRLAAATGPEALLMLDQQPAPVDVVLLDLRMPDMDGIEFLRGAAERHFQGSVLLLSGVDAGVLRAAERLAKAHGLALLGACPKPLAAPVLAELLQRAIARRAAVSDPI
jgi:CheY-like chemotaxis protein